MLLHIYPTRQRGKRTGPLARASGWYMTFFAAGVIAASDAPGQSRDPWSFVIPPEWGEGSAAPAWSHASRGKEATRTSKRNRLPWIDALRRR